MLPIPTVARGFTVGEGVHDQPCVDFWRRRLAAPSPGHRSGRAGRHSPCPWRARLDAPLALTLALLAGTPPEPPFAAAAAEFLTHYRSPDTVAAPVRSFVFTVGLVAFVWFVVALTTLLRRAEGEAAWRSAVAMAS